VWWWLPSGGGRCVCVCVVCVVVCVCVCVVCVVVCVCVCVVCVCVCVLLCDGSVLFCVWWSKSPLLSSTLANNNLRFANVLVQMFCCRINHTVVTVYSYRKVRCTNLLRTATSTLQGIATRVYSSVLSVSVLYSTIYRFINGALSANLQ
jgi:hypothetical protein